MNSMSLNEAVMRLRDAFGAKRDESLLQAAARFYTENHVLPEHAEQQHPIMSAAILVLRSAGWSGIEASYRLSEAAQQLPPALRLVEKP